MQADAETAFRCLHSRTSHHCFSGGAYIAIEAERRKELLMKGQGVAKFRPSHRLTMDGRYTEDDVVSRGEPHSASSRGETRGRRAEREEEEE